ncbi:MAG TPA: hypothetical protein VH394_28025 [Thermoanaerobaculia bacterium]|nr:hypothetical protein [Thermoanaerobaculia bacterium]
MLIGCLLGSSVAFLLLLQRRLAAPLMGGLLPEEVRFRAGSVPAFVEGLLADLVSGLLITLSQLVFLLILRIVLRRDAAALAVTWLYGMVLLTLIYGRPFAVTIPLAGLISLLGVFCWARFGLLAGLLYWLAMVMTYDYSMTLDLSAWYAWSGLIAMTLLLGLSAYGFLVSTAGRPWFSDSLLDD